MSSTSSSSPQLTSGSLSSDMSLHPLPDSLSPPPSTLFQSMVPNGTSPSDSFSNLSNTSFSAHLHHNSIPGPSRLSARPSPSPVSVTSSVSVSPHDRHSAGLYVLRGLQIGLIEEHFAGEIASMFTTFNEKYQQCENERVMFLERAERLERKVEELNTQLQSLMAQRTPQDLVPFMGLRGGSRYVSFRFYASV